MLRIVFCLAVVLIAANEAHGQLRVPSGCFVTDEERLLYNSPPECFNQGRASYLPFTTSGGYSEEQILSFYGFQYGFEINFSTDTFNKWQGAEARVVANANSANTHYGWYVSEFNKNKQLRGLESRLRKACGSKCKKVKTVSIQAEESTSTTMREAQPIQPGAVSSLSLDQYLLQRR